MIIEENGKLYNIDDETGLVTEASLVEAHEEDVIVAEEYQDLRVGDRVSVDGDEGKIVTIISSMYGPAFGVQFDDNSFDEYPEEKLSRVQTDDVDYETPLKEVQARFAAYEQTPAYTREEIVAKETEARNLNLRAKALITDQKCSYADQVELDRIILTTGTDLKDYQVLKDSEEANQEYLDSFKDSRFELAEQFKSTSSYGAVDDASWVDSAFHDIEETDDVDLATAAIEMVDAMSIDHLKDDEMVSLASSFQTERLVATDEQKETFANYVEQARQDRLSNHTEVKEASVEDTLDDDFDASALYL
jgi:hypothetical protein